MDGRHYSRARRLFVASLTASLLLPRVTLGQPNVDEAFARQIVQAASRSLMGRILPAFRAHLSAEEVQVLDRVDWRLTNDDWALRDVYASEDSRGPFVKISGGFINALYSLTRDLALCVALGKDQSTYLQYVQDFSDNASENDARARRGDPPILVGTYAAQIGISPDYANRVLEEMNYVDSITEGTISGLAFVSAHELGHHIHHDKMRGRSLAQIRGQEASADAFASALCIKAGFNPIGVIPVMFYYFLIEGDPDYRNPSATHPAAACRLRDVARLGVANLEAQPDFGTYLDADPARRPQWNKSKQSLSDLTARLGRDCDTY